jgi:beta-glucosidase
LGRKPINIFQNTHFFFLLSIFHLLVLDLCFALATSVSRPIKQLKGFKRITLQPKGKKKVTFKLFLEQLAFYDRHMELIIEPGTFKVIVGSSSEDVKLNGSFEVIGDAKVLHSCRFFFSEVNVD